MKCSNCKRQVRSSGKVCSYCGTSKSANQRSNAARQTGVILGIGLGISIGACFGVREAIEGLFIGAVAGIACGALVGLILNSIHKRAADMESASLMLDIDTDR